MTRVESRGGSVTTPVFLRRLPFSGFPGLMNFATHYLGNSTSRLGHALLSSSFSKKYAYPA